MAGIDRLSTRFIAKFWKFFRVPLFNYANCCFRKGTLTDTFKSATIRLIPKKGEISNIKNWRPISLLSNLYKVLSRAINNRLQTTTDWETSKAQKGFTKSRYLQEVLINVWETINHCKLNNINRAIMAIDMAKAFDTLSNGFLEEVLSFFGFGPTIRSWPKLLGNKRTGCILIDNGTTSRELSSGTR